MKKYYLIMIILMILLVSLSISNYQTRKDLKSYQTILIQSSNDTLNSYLYILNFEKQIVETENEIKRQEMLVTHKALTDILNNQRNSLRGTLMREEDIFKEYESLNIELKIADAMYDFNESTTLERKTELIENLETNIKVFIKFIKNIDYKEPEI